MTGFALKHNFVIIRNEFDTAHGSKTSYKDFENLELLDFSEFYRKSLFGFNLLKNDRHRIHQTTDAINNIEKLSYDGLINTLNDYIFECRY